MSQPTDLQYAKFGAYTAGILDGVIQKNVTEAEEFRIAIALLFVGLEQYGIEVRGNSFYDCQPSEED